MPPDESLENNANEVLPASAGCARLCFRPWPCAECSKGLTPTGYLFGRIEAGAITLRGSQDEVIAAQRDELLAWVKSCPHSTDQISELPKLARGSEHLVLFRESDVTVIKVTLSHTYGVYYEVRDGRIFQHAATRAAYLIRLRLWEKMFGLAPQDLGVTAEGCIVSVQPFITGAPPTQSEVNSFLMESGLEDVNSRCFLWKRASEHLDIWVGDTRDENFLRTETGIVPIDIRLWLANRAEQEPSSARWRSG